MSGPDRRWTADLGALAIIAGFYAVLHWLGVTCPIKFLTGISCPGCGMTRAWLSVLRLDFAAAFAFHPLFWLVIPAGALFLVRKKLPEKRFQGCLLALCLLFCGVYLLRLLSPADAVVVCRPQDGLIARLLGQAGRRLGLGG